MTELGPMQEKFEAWMENPLDLKKNADGKYLDLETCAYWITWQEAFEAGRSSLESENAELRQLLRNLLATDGHSLTPQCSFTGCNCGGVEKYKVARSEAVAVMRGIANG